MEWELIISCYLYQKRLAWMLSSIAQQVDGPKITLNLVYPSNNGNPNTESLAHYFSKYFYIKSTILPIESFAYRCDLRNEALKKATAECIGFIDTDLVFPTNFFNVLNYEMEHKNRRGILSCSKKFHSNLNATNAAIYNLNEIYIEDAYRKAYELGIDKIYDRNIAGGCLQFIKLQDIKDKNNGVYADITECRDRNMFKQGMATRTDKLFRWKMGGSYLVNLPMVVHLEHNRYNKYEGITEQR